MSEESLETDGSKTEAGTAMPAEPTRPPPGKTPMYQAMNALRYQRQSLIKQIQADTKRRLLCFVCGSATLIERDDTLGFMEILHNVRRGESIDLLLHTRGGDIDAAEKLISLLHRRVGEGTLRVVVPDYAKSAGTLMSLGANKIVMSDSSELGPIDPQIPLDDGHGNRIPHSVIHYLDAYSSAAQRLKDDPNDLAARIMLDKLDPTMLKRFETVRDRARDFAEKQLRQYMLQNRTDGAYTRIASELMDTKKWLTHGQMIDWQAAQALGLEIEYLPPDEKPWSDFWALYCVQRYSISDRGKLFESDYASYPVEGHRDDDG